MSDFDKLLERLLSDPSFAVRLAADPAAALSGYQLSPEEIELLSAQVSRDPGISGEVEARTSQASMFGLFAPLAGAAGLTALPDSRAGFGSVEAGAQAGFGAAGQVEGNAGFGVAASDGFGDGQADGMGIGDPIDGQVGGGHGSGPLGAAFGSDLSDLIGQNLDAQATAGFGEAEGGDVGTSMRQAELTPPTDYRTRVDVNGDGKWDAHMYVQRADGGIDILADMNADGHADFVGHDYDRNGLVDAADYDKDRDGRFETHWFDDNGDGWLDRKIVSPPPPEAPTS